MHASIKKKRRVLSGVKTWADPGRFVIKRVVQDLKALAREYAERIGNPAFLRDVIRATERENTTVAKRLRSTAARNVQ